MPIPRGGTKAHRTRLHPHKGVSIEDPQVAVYLLSIPASHDDDLSSYHLRGMVEARRGGGADRVHRYPYPVHQVQEVHVLVHRVLGTFASENKHARADEVRGVSVARRGQFASAVDLVPEVLGGVQYPGLVQIGELVIALEKVSSKGD